MKRKPEVGWAKRSVPNASNEHSAYPVGRVTVAPLPNLRQKNRMLFRPFAAFGGDRHAAGQQQPDQDKACAHEEYGGFAKTRMYPAAQ